MSVNSVNITARVCKDISFIPGSNESGAVLSFSLVVRERKRNKETGEWSSVPNYVDCVMFGDSASFISQKIHYGDKISVSGSLRQDRWTDRNGEKRSRLVVVVREVEWLESSSTKIDGQATEDVDMVEGEHYVR